MMERRTTIYPQKKRTPSFSSSLLDAIYRSIDESNSNLHENQQLGHSNETTIPKQNHKDNKEKMNLRRTVMVEDWIENQSFHTSHHFSNNSTSCSSESAFFSSSETDTTRRPKPRLSTEIQPLSFRFVKPRPPKLETKKPKRECGFVRTKLRALKQPISPGSRIASFLSSIFNSGNVKKAKMCNVGAVEDVTFEHTSKSPSCFSSSASSFSRRSCMSKTKPNNGIKRSVRFYPVSVILGEDNSQPFGQRYTYENDPSLLPLTRTCSIIKEVKKNSVVAKEKGYQNSGKVNNNRFGFRDFYDHDDDDEDDDDGLSCSSSDLFELDHLVGAGRYQEELPVYETTNLETNKAIANGLRL